LAPLGPLALVTKNVMLGNCGGGCWACDPLTTDIKPAQAISPLRCRRF
jgi:hypothetical protein